MERMIMSGIIMNDLRVKFTIFKTRIFKIENVSILSDLWVSTTVSKEKRNLVSILKQLAVCITVLCML